MNEIIKYANWHRNAYINFLFASNILFGCIAFPLCIISFGAAIGIEDTFLMVFLTLIPLLAFLFYNVLLIPYYLFIFKSKDFIHDISGKSNLSFEDYFKTENISYKKYRKFAFFACYFYMGYSSLWLIALFLSILNSYLTQDNSFPIVYTFIGVVLLFIFFVITFSIFYPFIIFLKIIKNKKLMLEILSK